jgi:hypothetical protein
VLAATANVDVHSAESLIGRAAVAPEWINDRSSIYGIPYLTRQATDRTRTALDETMEHLYAMVLRLRGLCDQG